MEKGSEKISRSEKLSTEAMIDRRKKSQLTKKRYIFRKHKKKTVDNQKKTKMSVSVKPDSLHSPSWGNQT